MGRLCTMLLFPFACYRLYFFLGPRSPIVRVRLCLHGPASGGAG